MSRSRSVSLGLARAPRRDYSPSLSSSNGSDSGQLIRGALGLQLGDGGDIEIKQVTGVQRTLLAFRDKIDRDFEQR